MPETSSERVTLRTVRQWVREGWRVPFLTCYDATTAAWLWRGGVKCLLVGDSASNVILGHDSTLPVTMPFMLEITAAVRRGAPGSFLLADMPFGSYQASADEAVSNAIAFMKHAGADAVKLEADASHGDLVARLTHAGVPIVAHLGWRPQQARYAGVKTAVVAGKNDADVAEQVRVARLMEDRGAVMLLVEQATAELTQEIVAAVNIPVIGCGAGPACHAHVVVLHDLLGLSDRHPSFVKPVANMGQQIADAARQWADLVQSGEYLRADHPYHRKSSSS